MKRQLRRVILSRSGEAARPDSIGPGLCQDPVTFLEGLQERLEAHFRRMREKRDEDGKGRPLFVLEHGLNDEDLQALQATARQVIATERPSERWWLPFLVYAAEIGYRYTGQEYWQTFKESTPGWTREGDRRYVREQFRRFARVFGGAEPRGAWAEQFSIICWPITHAILPTDLQIRLAKLLYDYRAALTSDLVQNPNELGARVAVLAKRSSSKRFRRFAENGGLLGQVTAALLLGDESGDSAHLQASALHRIVGDLSEHRQARSWLHGARTSAARVTLRGLSRGGAPREGSREAGGKAARPVVPSLALRLRGDGVWTAELETPDLSPIFARFPELEEMASRCRCSVAGFTGAPRPSEFLLFPGQRLRLDEWPEANAAWFRLEDADENHNQVLADECWISAGTVWLFRVEEDARAIEVHSRTVRPGRRYVVVSSERVPEGLPDWVNPTFLACEGVDAVEIRVPVPLDGGGASTVRALGLQLAGDVELRPAGFVAAAWDGEGSVEWVAGDEPLIALSSTLDVAACAVSLDDGPQVDLAWPDRREGGPIFVRLRDLDLGPHKVRVRLTPKAAGLATVEGLLKVNIREPRPRSSCGSYREPLILLAEPLHPTMGEVWDGRTDIELVGPAALRVDVQVSLEEAPGSPSISKRLPRMALPVTGETWRHAFAQHFRRDPGAQEFYDGAEACLIEAFHPDLGSVLLRCEREFSPLRWGIGQDREGSFLRLHDNAGGSAVVVTRFDFAQPDVEKTVVLAEGAEIRWDAGGFFLARAGDFEASVILPPRVRKLEDLKATRIRSRLTPQRRTAASILDSMSLAARWASAEIPGKLLAAMLRDSVLRAVTASICGQIGGDRWAEGERRLDEQIEALGPGALRELGGLIDRRASRSATPESLVSAANRWAEMTPAERVTEFAPLVQRELSMSASAVARSVWLAGFLMRLASNPAAALGWAGDMAGEGAEAALASPVLLRMARYLVLACHLAADASIPSSPYRGWTWQ